MAKQKQTIDLYGEQFTIVKGNTIPHKRYESLYDAYANPSIKKRNIWGAWVEWYRNILHDNNFAEIYITSNNVHFFSIGGYIDTPIGERWAYLITSTRQEVWIVSDNI